jgi:hypothetical protein
MISLNRAYGGYNSGAIVQLPKDTEDALIAQGLAVTSAGPTSTGAVTTSYFSGKAAIAAGASSVVVTHAACNIGSNAFAVVAQAAADGTLLRVERVVCAAGSFTIHGTANATATTLINWQLFP